MFVYIIGTFRDVLAVSPIFDALGFVRGHAKRQSGCRRSRSQKCPRRPRKGITNIADKIGTFSSVFASLGIAAAPFRKTTALLDTLGRLFYILYQVGGLTIQERANLINVL